MLPIWKIPPVESEDPKPRLESPPAPVSIGHLMERARWWFVQSWFNGIDFFLALLTVEHYRGASAGKLLKKKLTTNNHHQISLSYYGIRLLLKTLSIMTTYFVHLLCTRNNDKLFIINVCALHTCHLNSQSPHKAGEVFNPIFRGEKKVRPKKVK